MNFPNNQIEKRKLPETSRLPTGRVDAVWDAIYDIYVK